MSIRIDREKARETYRRALELVESGEHLPEEWTKRANALKSSPSKTYIPMLGTALLARATDPRADPLSLKARASAASGFESYSARGLATDVLAPEAKASGVDIGTGGGEPLNNQPFFHNDYIRRDMVVLENARPSFELLVESLERVRDLPAEDLLPALAAFIAVNRRVARAPAPRIEIAAGSWTINEFVDAVEGFVKSWPEDGKRGQAMVAAALDLAFPQVRLGHVNDPGRTIPGDVFAYANESARQPHSSSEVKQKAVTAAEVELFAARLATAGIKTGMYAMLSPQQPEVDAEGLSEAILRRHNILMRVYTSVRDFLLDAMSWSQGGVEEFMREFPNRMAERLREAGVAETSLDDWDNLFRSDPD